MFFWSILVSGRDIINAFPHLFSILDMFRFAFETQNWVGCGVQCHLPALKCIDCLAGCEPSVILFLRRAADARLTRSPVLKIAETERERQQVSSVSADGSRLRLISFRQTS